MYGVKSVNTRAIKNLNAVFFTKGLIRQNQDERRKGKTDDEIEYTCLKMPRLTLGFTHS